MPQLCAGKGVAQHVSADWTPLVHRVRLGFRDGNKMNPAIPRGAIIEDGPSLAYKLETELYNSLRRRAESHGLVLPDAPHELHRHFHGR